MSVFVDNLKIAGWDMLHYSAFGWVVNRSPVLNSDVTPLKTIWNQQIGGWYVYIDMYVYIYTKIFLPGYGYCSTPTEMLICSSVFGGMLKFQHFPAIHVWECSHFSLYNSFWYKQQLKQWKMVIGRTCLFGPCIFQVRAVITEISPPGRSPNKQTNKQYASLGNSWWLMIALHQAPHSFGNLMTPQKGKQQWTSCTCRTQG